MKQLLKGPALYKAIRDYIKQYVLEHDLKPGEPLPPEGQLVEDLGVSRSSVREAVKSLQSLGIVDVRQGDGLYVRELNFDSMLEAFQFGMQFDPHTVAELLQIRIWLEMAVIGDAVKQIRTEELARLESIINDWDERIQIGENYIDLDEEFHSTIYAVLKNQTLMKLFDTFWVAFLGLENDNIQHSDPVGELQSHREILNAIKSGDTDHTRNQLQFHFDNIKSRIDQYLLSSATSP